MSEAEHLFLEYEPLYSFDEYLSCSLPTVNISLLVLLISGKSPTLGILFVTGARISLVRLPSQSATGEASQQQRCLFSEFWRLDARDQGAGGFGFLRGSSAWSSSPQLAGLSLCPRTVCALSVHLTGDSVCPHGPFIYTHQSDPGRVRPKGHILTSSPPPKPHLQMQSHCEVAEVRASVCEFEGLRFSP